MQIGQHVVNIVKVKILVNLNIENNLEKGLNVFIKEILYWSKIS